MKHLSSQSSLEDHQFARLVELYFDGFVRALQQSSDEFIAAFNAGIERLVATIEEVLRKEGVPRDAL